MSIVHTLKFIRRYIRSTPCDLFEVNAISKEIFGKFIIEIISSLLKYLFLKRLKILFFK